MTKNIRLSIITIIGAGLLVAVCAQPKLSRQSAAQPSYSPAPQQLPPCSTRDPRLSAQCPTVPQWKQLPETERRSLIPKIFGIQYTCDECFAAMVSGLHAADRKLLKDSLTTVFSSRAAKGRFSQELFIALFKNNNIVSNKQLWDKIIDIWADAGDQPIYAVLAVHSEGGKLPVADTLYRALDAAGRLDAHELLRFGRVKCLLGDYAAAAAIYCRVIAEDKRVEHAALTQMGQLFADADSAVKSAALDKFEACVFSLPSGDTAFYRNWLADFYGRGGLYEKEVAILTKFDTPASPSGRKLADAAKAHFSRRRYRQAATAAVAAAGRLDKAEQPQAAFVAYQAYMQLRAKDSALIWLKRSEVTSKDARVQSVALHQEAGHTQEAAALLDSMPLSLAKDTLVVRQYLFTGETGKALNHTSSPHVSWIMNPRERALWMSRSLIFSGRPYDAAAIIDTLRFMQSWHGTAEVLRYKYWFQKLEDDQSALDVWGKLEYSIYTGDLTTAAQNLRKYGLKGESGEMMAVRLARALAGAERVKEALEILELVESSQAVGGEIDYGIKGIPGRQDNDKSGKNKTRSETQRSAEYLYFKAEMLNESGRQEEARAIANKILKDYPADVFAQKARILLSRILY